MKHYPCPMCCNEGFCSLEDLKQHLLKADRAMSCPACFKSFKNLLFLIKHLDNCSAVEKNEDSEETYSKFGDKIEIDSPESDDDDFDGYFCTVCDMKIPDVDKHIQQCHTGQEIILQDDDDDDDNDDDEDDADDGDDNYKSVKYPISATTSISSPIGKGSKRKLTEMIQKESGENDKNDDILYCSLCDVTFDSLVQHTSVFHKNSELHVQKLSIRELFSTSTQKKGSITYFCTSCHKTITRHKALSKHLNIRPFKHEQRKRSKSYSRDNSEPSKSAFDVKENNYTNNPNMHALKLENDDFTELKDIEHTIFDS